MEPPDDTNCHSTCPASRAPLYPARDIDKRRDRGETPLVDPELRDALDRLAEDLRGEIRSGDAETRAYVDVRFETLSAQFTGLDRRFEALGVHVETRFVDLRCHFDVMAESLRGDIRSLAELMAISNERSDRQITEQAGRIDGLEGRVLGLEVRVTRLEDDRPSRRPRRQR